MVKKNLHRFLYDGIQIVINIYKKIRLDGCVSSIYPSAAVVVYPYYTVLGRLLDSAAFRVNI